MGLNDAPSGERIHIGFFGRRNAGKSSVVNAVTNQDLAVVSDTKGTTTDPVTKAMELLPLGPVVIIDTPGFDDEGELGELRVKKTKQILNRLRSSCYRLHFAPWRLRKTAYLNIQREKHTFYYSQKQSRPAH